MAKRRQETASRGATTREGVKAKSMGREVRVILEPLAALVGKFVAGELRAMTAGTESSRYYTAQTSPLPRKAFLAAARADYFPSFVIKRRVYALRDDVHRFIESRRRTPSAVPAGTRTDDDEIGRLLDEANLRRRRQR
ncbi:MAG: hypothetical protein KIT84_43165 [Labilithrix sp.]|nr:hypothetical protein [Labilithrix sp.]MCW5817879.1 hypothetical protein [Labilithrix sp.]